MIQLARMAGFFAAHAVWCVSDGEVLVPFGACEASDGQRKLNRFVTNMLEEGVAQAREWALENPARAARTMAIYDGYITLEAGKTDALLVQAYLFVERGLGVLRPRLEHRLLMAVPYRNAASAEGFAVFRPKFLEFDGAEPELSTLAAPFFEGVDQHAKGAAVWNACINQTW